MTERQTGNFRALALELPQSCAEPSTPPGVDPVQQAFVFSMQWFRAIG